MRLRKQTPIPRKPDVVNRLSEIQEAITVSDAEPQNEFQSLAFGKKALAFINAARRELKWRTDSTDRSVAAIMIHFLHAKLGQGLSNQLRHSRSLSPQYSIRWWRSRGLETPPDIEPVSFLAQRVAWRYSKGLPKHSGSNRARILLGDAGSTLPLLNTSADLI